MANNRTGSGFVNLQQYLDANQNNNIEGTVANGIDQEADQAKTDIANSTNQFDTDSNNASIDSTQNQADATRIMGEAANATQDSDVSADDYNTFNNIRTGTYQGPTSLSNLGTLQTEAQSAQEAAGASGSEAGRYGLLQRYLGGNDGYNTGEQTLDNALLGNSSGTQLKAASENAANLGQSVTDANTAAGNQALLNENQGKQYQTQLLAQLGVDPNGNTLSTDITGGIDPNITVGSTGYNGTNAYNANYGKLNDTTNVNSNGLIQTAYNNAYNNDYTPQLGSYQNILNLQNAATNGTLNQAQASQLGLTMGERLYGVDPSQSAYISTTPGNAPTIQNTATTGDYAKINALTKLAGITNGSLLSNSAAAATYQPTQAYSVNPNGTLQAAITAGQNKYQSDLNAATIAIPQIPAAGSNPFTQAHADPNATVTQSVPQAITSLQNLISYGNTDPNGPNAKFTPQTISNYQSLLAAAKRQQQNIQNNDGYNDILGGSSSRFNSGGNRT